MCHVKGEMESQCGVKFIFNNVLKECFFKKLMFSKDLVEGIA